jgi:hypothetical protein
VYRYSKVQLVEHTTAVPDLLILRLHDSNTPKKKEESRKPPHLITLYSPPSKVRRTNYNRVAVCGHRYCTSTVRLQHGRGGRTQNPNPYLGLARLCITRTSSPLRTRASVLGHLRLVDNIMSDLYTLFHFVLPKHTICHSLHFNTH